MAKGQQRGNREVKKPKQDKPAGSSSWSTIDKLRAKGETARKK